MDEKTVARFWGNVEKTGGCWLWLGRRSPAGYGRFKAAGREQGAHRVAFELAFGRSAAGMVVCHRCDNPPCCNPAHLFLGTHAENVADKVAKGRQCRGADFWSTKLTPAAVLEIRTLLASGRSQRSVARQFGVYQSTIRRIWIGLTWNHL